MNTYINQYKKNEVETASPEQILILLYDGAIRFLIKAKQAIADNDVQETHNNIVACENIILEFMSSLDMENGGDLAQRLYNLYDYFYNVLVQANIKKDEQKVNEVLKHLKGLRETWQKAINIANQERLQSADNNLIDEDIDAYDTDDDNEEGE
jgi:flagellar protein FliS